MSSIFPAMYDQTLRARSCTNELQKEKNCRIKFGLVCQLLAKPAQRSCLLRAVLCLKILWARQPRQATHSSEQKNSKKFYRFKLKRSSRWSYKYLWSYNLNHHKWLPGPKYFFIQYSTKQTVPFILQFTFSCNSLVHDLGPSSWWASRWVRK